jgi:hypothetical protein
VSLIVVRVEQLICLFLTRPKDFGKKNSFAKNLLESCEGEDRGWLAVIEEQGLHQEAEILENYGINSETDVSVLDRDDFCKLVSGGLRPLEAWTSF